MQSLNVCYLLLSSCLRVQMYVWLCQVVKASFLYGYHSALHLREAWIELGYTELVFSADTPVLLHTQHHLRERKG